MFQFFLLIYTFFIYLYPFLITFRLSLIRLFRRLNHRRRHLYTNPLPTATLLQLFTPTNTSINSTTTTPPFRIVHATSSPFNFVDDDNDADELNGYARWNMKVNLEDLEPRDSRRVQKVKLGEGESLRRWNITVICLLTRWIMQGLMMMVLVGSTFVPSLPPTPLRDSSARAREGRLRGINVEEMMKMIPLTSQDDDDGEVDLEQFLSIIDTPNVSLSTFENHPSLIFLITTLSLFPLLIDLLGRSVRGIRKVEWGLLGWAMVDCMIGCWEVGEMMVAQDVSMMTLKVLIGTMKVGLSGGVVWNVAGANLEGIKRGDVNDKVSPELTSSLISRLTFSWVNDLIKRATTNTTSLCSSSSFTSSQKQDSRQIESIDSENKGEEYEEYESSRRDGEIKVKGDEDWIWSFFPTETSHYVSRFWARTNFGSEGTIDLYRILWKVNKYSLFVIFGGGALAAIVELMTPVYMKRLVDMSHVLVQERDEDRRVMGMVYQNISYTFFWQIIHLIVDGIYLREIQNMERRIVSCLSNAINAKVLKLRVQSSQINVSTLITFDCHHIRQFISIHLRTFSGPVISIFSTVLITWWQVGWSSLLVLLSGAFITTIVSTWLMNQFKGTMAEMYHANVVTNAKIEDIIRSIRYIKATATEEKSEEEAMRLRVKYTAIWWRQKMILTALLSTWYSVPDVLVWVVFLWMFGIKDRGFEMGMTFILANRLRALKNPFSMIPWSIESFKFARHCLVNIENFLRRPEVEPRDWETMNETVDKGFHLTNAWFISHSEDQSQDRDLYDSKKQKMFTLKDITLSLENEGLTVISGPSGSGKSLLLLALLGELELIRGSAVRSSKGVAYVLQKRWVASGTIRSQILFSEPYEEERYQQVLEACNLGPDLSSLKDGDMTEFTYGNSTLSGGQEARIAIARALYSSLRYIFLDEPLSALDNETASHLLFHCLQGPLVRGRTMVVTTVHADLFMPFASNVFDMEDGRLSKRKRLGVLSTTSSFTSLVPSEPGCPPLQNHELGQQSLVYHNRWAPLKDYVYAVGWPNWVLTISVLFVITYLYRRDAELFAAWSQNAHQSMQMLFNIIALGITRMSLHTANIYASYIGSSAASNNLFRSALGGILHAPLDWHVSQPKGSILSRFGDFEMVDNQLVNSLGFLFLNSFTALSVLLQFLTIEIYFLVFIPIFWWLAIICRKNMTTCRKLRISEGKRKEEMISQLNANLSGNVVIRAFKLEETVTLKFQKSIDDFIAPSNLMGASMLWMDLRFQFYGAILVVGFSVIASHRFCQTKEIGNLSFILDQAISLPTLLFGAAKAWSLLEADLPAVERVVSLTRAPREDTISPIYVAPTFLQPVSSTMKPVPSPITICFKNVWVRFGNTGQCALQGINVTLTSDISPRVAIVGRTGSGKSSCGNVLMRFVDWNKEGSIEINGLDSRKVPLNVLRRNITFLSQDTAESIIKGTFKSVLDEEGIHTDEEIIHALERVNFPLPTSLSEFISTGGQNFSAGQRQLLALARALLRKRRILILDEAFGSLSRESEAHVQKVIAQELKNSIIISISHRLHSILDYDRVLVLDSGKIVEDGKPKTLLSSSSTYFYKLWTLGDDHLHSC